MKRVFAVALSVMMVISLAACNQQTEGSSTSVNSQYKQEIASSAKKLNDTYTNYIVSTTIEFAGSSQEYIEVVKGDDIYTEYSVDDEGNVGGISYGSNATISYALTNWTHEGTFYSVGYDDAGNEMLYKFPSNYTTKYEYDREMLYVNRLLAGAKSIETYDDLELTLGGVTETYKAYRIRVDSDTVAQIMSSDTWGVYRSVKDNEKAGSNISKLCDFYIEDMELLNTYSDGIVIVGIDSNGMLKFMSLEIGGLGTHMFVTKAVVDISNQNVRNTPDFSGAIPIESTMTELADFVAQYPDHDSAVKALNEMYSQEFEDYQAQLGGLEGDLNGDENETGGSGSDTDEGGAGGSETEEDGEVE